MSKSVVSSSSDIMGGTPVFPGTRVPVQTLLDYINAGDSIDDFLLGFPTVKCEQVVAFLKHAGMAPGVNADTSMPSDSWLRH
jgi:uncharacterized protein (DUF433 family)